MLSFCFVSFVCFISRAIAEVSNVDPDTVAFQVNETSGGCVQACYVLNAALFDQTSLPNSAAYGLGSEHWAAQQAALRSTCRVAPNTAEQVSIALTTLRQYECQFAVKSGGHAPIAGASNIEGGVTIDLGNMKEVTVSEDKTVTRLGPGNRWAEVYSKLDPMNLSVVGGRVADIGVGGLILGGGISFFTGRFGFACDNVLNFEVVFADGSIHDVNEESFPDLFSALRGGGNNFGIVTRFDVFTFPQGNLWGGPNYYTFDKVPLLIDAFTNFNINAPKDPYGAVIAAIGYVPEQKMWLSFADLAYGKPEADPPILRNFTSIEAIGGGMRITSLTNLTIAMKEVNPDGMRDSYWTFVFQNDANLMTKLIEICQEESLPILEVSGLVNACVFQPLTTKSIAFSSSRGGNAFGLHDSEGPLVVFMVAISWSLASDDDIVMAYARRVIEQGNNTAHELGKGHRYMYQNYAAAEQKVFEGYGADNLEKLRKVSKQYDPTGVFQRLQPGYFKL